MIEKAVFHYTGLTLNSSTKRYNFRRVQIENICRRRMKVVQMMKFVSERVETIAGKGENAGYQYFLLFPQSFQKPFS